MGYILVFDVYALWVYTISITGEVPMMEEKKIPQAPMPPALNPEPQKGPVPVQVPKEKPKKKDKTAEFRKGMANLVGCGDVPDFGSKVRAKIEAYREKMRQKKAAKEQGKTPATQDLRARLEAQKKAYHDTQKVQAPIVPDKQKMQSEQKTQPNFGLALKGRQASRAA